MLYGNITIKEYVFTIRIKEGIGMSNFQEEKKLVLKYFDEMENAGYEDVKGVMEKYMTPEYNFIHFVNRKELRMRQRYFLFH